jgi:hypothetical protein
MKSTWVRVVLGLAVGTVLGASCCGVLLGVVGYSMVKKAERDVRIGWMVRPVAAAASDLSAGTEIKFADVSVRKVPDGIATVSIVNPDSVSYVIGQRIRAPVSKGDPLWWGFFENSEVPFADRTLAAACSDAFDASPRAPKRESTLAEIRARLTSGGVR